MASQDLTGFQAYENAAIWRAISTVAWIWKVKRLVLWLLWPLKHFNLNMRPVISDLSCIWKRTQRLPSAGAPHCWKGLRKGSG